MNRSIDVSDAMRVVRRGALPLLVAAALARAQQPAFPTAGGSGMFAAGGRGGAVYEVTNLSNSGPGSIVDAVSAANRTIVFRLSGTIELGSVLLRPKSNTTIAGQTAPGDGICLKGRIYIGSVSDVVIRHIRVRVDAGAANSSGDAVDVDGGTNIIIDHVSASYARDEGISCQETSDKVTVQWCIISEALTYENHSYGSLIRGDYGDEKSYHHNLYVHDNNRLPRPGNYTLTASDPEGLHFDFRNNVVYNWKGTEPGYNADIGATSRYTFIGNVYIPGPESTVRNTIFKESSVDVYGYFENNSYDGVVPADPWSQVTFNGFTTDQIAAYKARSYIVPMKPVTTTSPDQARIDVLASAGACVPARDTIDRRLVQDVLNRTGHSIDSTIHQPEGGWPLLSSTTPPTDSDHDGMPDDWELAHGLNPNDSTDRNSIGQDGYTQLEVYLNTLTGEIVAGVGAEDAPAHPRSFALYQNFPNPFNPTTIVSYQVPVQSDVRLTVFDQLGKEVALLVNARKAAGRYEALFDAARLASGVYFYRLRALSVAPGTPGEYVQTRKMLLIH